MAEGCTPISVESCKVCNKADTCEAARAWLDGADGGISFTEAAFKRMERDKTDSEVDELKIDLEPAMNAIFEKRQLCPETPAGTFASYRLKRPISMTVPVVEADGSTGLAGFTLKVPTIYFKADAEGFAVEDEQGNVPAYELMYYKGEPGEEEKRFAEGATITWEDGEWRQMLRPIVRGGVTLDYWDLITAAAVAYVRERGDRERAQRIWNVWYHIEPGDGASPTNAMDMLDVAERAAAPTVPAVNKALERQPYDRSFAYKAFKGFEDIAFSGESHYDLAPRSGRTKQKISLQTNAEKAAAFIGCRGANGNLAARVREIIAELMRQPEAVAARFNGRVWISVNTIINELTRTTAGTNDNLKRKGSDYRETVNSCIDLLSASQMAVYDHAGKLAYQGYVLNAEYMAEVKDAAGNTVKDVWGFLDTEQIKRFEALTAEQVTRRDPLNLPSPLNPDNAWMSHYLEANVLSEIRARLYPARGKAEKSWTATRSLDDLFMTAAPAEAGNINQHRKETVLKNLESVLVALAEQERKASNPIWIQAKAVRDGHRGKGRGAWVSLVVTGYKQPRKAYIGLSGDGHKPLNPPATKAKKPGK